MENHPLRAFLGRWLRAIVQAGALAVGVSSLACAPASRPHPGPPRPRVAPDTLVVRTTSFAFQMGKRVDETWPEKAEETRALLGQSLAVLLEEEDTTVPVLARQLGVVWPAEQVELDVKIGGGDGAESRPLELPRLVVVGGGEPSRAFFASVLERALVRLAPESAMFRAIASSRADAGEGAEGDGERLYACVAAVATYAVVVARARDEKDARGVERVIRERCAPREREWVTREWIARVKEEESAEAFGVRAARALR